MSRPFDPGRVGVKADGRYRHYMAGPVNNTVSCGGLSVRNWRVARGAAGRQVDCPQCREIAASEERV